jgi:hypothetical protein
MPSYNLQDPISCENAVRDMHELQMRTFNSMSPKWLPRGAAGSRVLHDDRPLKDHWTGNEPIQDVGKSSSRKPHGRDQLSCS